MNTETILTVIAGHLAAVGLAQYNPDGVGYLNHPDLPAVLFAGADVPDCALVLSCVDEDTGLGQYQIEFAFRTTGINPIGVDALADNVFEHFRAVLGIQAAATVAGTVVTMPSLVLPGLLEWTEAQRLSRGRAEPTSEAKHHGNRFVRRDVYLMTIHEA